ncbi:hypothetical protein ElyMa_004922000 [Elysia marginata]|uniref:Uncharacterized protein n=1 Tax=Elysia marginata TaxID=1093978 RepID=A0AAV4IWV1_9GAST|nr:hypothetical protein ElyMa_004922000 [Elysia marginata]
MGTTFNEDMRSCPDIAQHRQRWARLSTRTREAAETLHSTDNNGHDFQRGHEKLPRHCPAQTTMGTTFNEDTRSCWDIAQHRQHWARLSTKTQEAAGTLPSTDNNRHDFQRRHEKLLRHCPAQTTIGTTFNEDTRSC